MVCPSCFCSAQVELSVTDGNTVKKCLECTYCGTRWTVRGGVILMSRDDEQARI